MSKLVKANGYINFMQVWDYNSDGTMTFNFLYSFERDNKVIRREEFQEIYYPVRREMLEKLLIELGFDEIEIYNFTNPKIKKFEDMEWYSIIARKLA